MNPKVEKAHAHITGTDVAHMIIDFHSEFNDVYGRDTLASSLCAVGPLQSMIGHAIENGWLQLGPRIKEQ